MVDIYQIRPGSYATVAEVKEEGGTGDVTKEYVDTQIASVRSDIPDVSGLATKTEVETGLSAKKDKATLYTTSGADGETENNPIALKDFVNSSIGTNTANYISNNGEPFTSVSALESYSGTVTNNDYAFVSGTDSEGNAYYDRYKATVDGATVTWAKEYRLNNSSFTQAQWNAISSGITAGKVAQYDGYASLIAGKQDAGDYATTTALNTAIAGIRQVPASTSADEDKVLTVDANGDIGWETGGGGGTPSNMVTTDTEQTITGKKTIVTDAKLGDSDNTTISNLQCSYYTSTGSPTLAGAPVAKIANKYTENGTTYTKNYVIKTGILQIGPLARFPTLNTIGLYTNRGQSTAIETQTSTDPLLVLLSDANVTTVVRGNFAVSTAAPSGLNTFTDELSCNTNKVLVHSKWVKDLMPEITITGDGTTTQFTVTHALGKMPGIVQVTKATGEVVKDSDITIVKSTTNVVITFTTAPADQDVYTVAMLY